MTLSPDLPKLLDNVLRMRPVRAHDVPIMPVVRAHTDAIMIVEALMDDEGDDIF